MRKFSATLLLLFTCLALPLHLRAQPPGTCAQYLGRGYCTDYVQQRTGRRQGGDARAWQGNLPTHQGQAGDVIIQRFGTYGHVAVIERPVYQPNTARVVAYDVSEMNWGPFVKPECAVTTNFGRVTSRRVSLSQVSAVWRP